MSAAKVEKLRPEIASAIQELLLAHEALDNGETLEISLRIVSTPRVTVAIEADATLLAKYIDDLAQIHHLSKRAITNLRMRGVHFLGSLVRCTEDDLMGFEGIGQVQVNEIKSWLASFGYALGMKIPMSETEIEAARACLSNHLPIIPFWYDWQTALVSRLTTYGAVADAPREVFANISDAIKAGGASQETALRNRLRVIQQGLQLAGLSLSFQVD
jgi:hypothetical protein